jgi:hypothetical protein
MKNLRYFLLALTLLAPLAGTGQPANSLPTPSPLTKFDLDFPGGTPEQLIAAIEHAMGHPLNAIVPDASKNEAIPPLKMKGVDASELFAALRRATTSSRKFGSQYQNTSFSFTCQEAPLTDNSIWVFYDDLPQDSKQCQFFLLTPYLQGGLTVDDITTAIQTGWKMLGGPRAPALSYHPETKLLIAVGDDDQLSTIGQALQALNGMQRKAGAASASKLQP